MPMLFNPYQYEIGRTIEVTQEEYNALLSRSTSVPLDAIGCAANSPTGWGCTLERGHKDNHIAYGGGDSVCCTWPHGEYPRPIGAEPTPPAEEAHT